MADLWAAFLHSGRPAKLDVEVFPPLPELTPEDMGQGDLAVGLTADGAAGRVLLVLAFGILWFGGVSLGHRGPVWHKMLKSL